MIEERGHTVKGQGSKAKQGSDTMDRAVGWISNAWLGLLPARGSETSYSLLNTLIFSL